MEKEKLNRNTKGDSDESTRLLTLKEIGGISSFLPKLNKSETFISESELRAEAVKWVKEMDDRMNKAPTQLLQNYWQGRKDMLMEFFNLTEEDLE